jgi:predicted dehydrogenase
MNRRIFLQSSAALLVVPTTIPSIARASVKNVSANDKINAALIGCRGMGWGDLADLLAHNDVRCLALSDIDREVLHSRAEQVNREFGFKPDLYGDYRKILDRKDIDLVIIATPDHWHCQQFVDACKAGKDVYVEKPIANSIAECDRMVAAAQQYKRVVQVGQQQRSSKHWQQMVEYIRSGALGKIGRVQVWANFNYAAMPPLGPNTPVPEGVDFDTWLGSAPKVPFNPQRFHGSWRMFWDYGGGLVTDWGVHLLDMGLWGMDIKTMPLKVSSTGGNYLFPNGAHETFDTMATTYRFKDFIMEWENNAGVESGPYGKSYGVLFRGTNGTLVADREDWTVYPEGERTPALQVKADHRDHEDHLTNFLNCVKGRNFNTACTIENGNLCAKYAQLANIGAKLGGEGLVYDDHSKRFNLSEANKYLYPYPDSEKRN